MALVRYNIKPLCFASSYMSRSLSFLSPFFKKDEPIVDEPNNFNIHLENAFRVYKLDTEPKSSVTVTKAQALQMYVQMQTIRRLENACASLYKEKIIRGFCHLYSGQEACCAGIYAAKREVDTVITSYRCHSWTWIMGTSLHALLAELCQKQTGANRGKAGSMHTYGKNFFGGNGIVGSQIPIGLGLALAHVYRSDGGVSLTLYGDGAANQGQLHESFNMACLWKLPMIFVVENNKYGMGTSISRSSCSTDYYCRVNYIPGLWVNGMDVLAVRSATEFAIDYALNCGPLVMELETYRYFGHSMSDPGTSYRTRDEIQAVRQTSDPITTYVDLCLQHNILTEEEIKKSDDEIKKQIRAASEQAKADKATDVAELSSDLYLNCLHKTIRGVVNNNLKHFNVGQQYVPRGTAKPTPKELINEPSAEEPPKKDGKVVEASKDEATQPSNNGKGKSTNPPKP